MLSLFAMILALSLSYMVIKMIKKCKQKPAVPKPNFGNSTQNCAPEPEPGHGYNNSTHNPALVTSVVQALFMVVVYTGVIIPGMFVTNQGPNGFIIGYLPMLMTALLVIPSLFYAFNANLRKFVVREVKEALGLNVLTVIV